MSKTKRLNIHIPVELHKQIRILVAEHEISITTWIMRLIAKEIDFRNLFKNEKDSE